MKNVIIAVMLFFAAVFPLSAEVISMDPEATPKPIRITVEGIPDSKPTSLTTQKDVFFKNELFKPAPTKVPAADIKKMAEENVTESEIIDAIITKLSDMEAELEKQKFFNKSLIAATAALFVLLALLFLKKNKKG